MSKYAALHTLLYARMERSGGWQTSVTTELTEFLAELDMFFWARRTPKAIRTFNSAAARQAF
jgi:hypothetical protein